MRLKYAFDEIDLRSGGDQLELLSVSIHGGVRPRRDIADDGDGRADDTSSYKRCAPGDLVINRMRAFQGALGVAPIAGLVSPDYAVLRLADGHDPRFISYLLRSPWGISEMSARLRGIGGSGANGAVRTPRVNVPDIGEIDAPLPALETQRRVADFLDRECARIDELRNTVHRFVTAVIESDRTRREATLREHAAAFGRVKLGWAVGILSGYAFPSDGFVDRAMDGAIPLLRGVNVVPGGIRWDDVVYWPPERTPQLRRFALRDGDLVLGMDRPWIKSGLRCARVTQADLPCLLLQRVAALRPFSGTLESAYVQLALESDMFREHAELDLTGVSVPHISPAQIGAFRIPRPPIEQQLSFVRAESAIAIQLRELTRHAELFIDALTEYRGALLADAVTGNVDVINLAGAELRQRFEAETISPRES